LSTDRIATLVTEMTETAQNIKDAQKVQRKRIKDILAVKELGFLTDAQLEAVAPFLPKPRPAKDK